MYQTDIMLIVRDRVSETNYYTSIGDYVLTCNLEKTNSEQTLV